MAAKDKAPSGAAGGDLTGTYPNPEIAPGVVIQDLSVDGALGIASGDAVFVSCSGPGSIPAPPIANGTASRTAGQIILPSGTTSAVVCTVTFNFPYQNNPICTVSPVTAAGQFYRLSVAAPPLLSNQIAVLSDGPFASGDGFNYICIDH